MELRTVPMGQALKVDVTEGGVRLVDYQPGNGTRYSLMLVHVGAPFTPEHREGAGLTAGTQYVVTLLTTKQTMTLVESTSPIHYGYVREKLRCGVADAHVLAELLGYLTGRGSYAERPQIPTDHVVHKTPAPLVVECGTCHRRDSIPALKVMEARPGEETSYPLKHTCMGCDALNTFIIDLTEFAV